MRKIKKCILAPGVILAVFTLQILISGCYADELEVTDSVSFQNLSLDFPEQFEERTKTFGSLYCWVDIGPWPSDETGLEIEVGFSLYAAGAPVQVKVQNLVAYMAKDSVHGTIFYRADVGEVILSDPKADPVTKSVVVPFPDKTGRYYIYFTFYCDIFGEYDSRSAYGDSYYSDVPWVEFGLKEKPQVSSTQTSEQTTLPAMQESASRTSLNGSLPVLEYYWIAVLTGAVLVIIVSLFLYRRRRIPSLRPEKRTCPRCGGEAGAQLTICPNCGEILGTEDHV